MQKCVHACVSKKELEKPRNFLMLIKTRETRMFICQNFHKKTRKLAGIFFSKNWETRSDDLPRTSNLCAPNSHFYPNFQSRNRNLLASLLSRCSSSAAIAGIRISTLMELVSARSNLQFVQDISCRVFFEILDSFCTLEPSLYLESPSYSVC